ncbi:MAG: hypothetical protein J1F22_02515 [Lachnospiraceae bacterium]|nr:hypothetical protein [Lachnospiraceae bacterium]
MKNIFQYVIPYTCMGVTAVLITTSAFNIFAGENTWYYMEWLLMAAVIFILYSIQFGVLEHIEFKTTGGYYTAEFLFWYIGFGVFLFGTGWTGFCGKNVLIYTGIVMAVSIALHMYSKIYLRIQADEINRLLEDYRKG